MKRMKTFSILLALLVAACSTSNPQQDAMTTSGSSGGYSASAGPNPVGVIPTAVLRDGQRNRDVEMTIDYPTRTGPFPVIVFSHDLGGSSGGYVALTEYWTSNGYVCIKPKHADAGSLKDDKELKAVTARQTDAELNARARDVLFIIDSLAAIEEKYPELRDRVDRTRVGVGGQGDGALTALQLAGLHTTSAKGVTVADARLKGVLAIGTPGVGEARGVTAESFREVKAPVLFMTAAPDQDATEVPDHRHDAFQFSPAGDKYYVAIAGANRTTFGGRFDLTEEELKGRRSGTAPPVYRDPRDPNYVDPRDPAYQQQDPPQGNGSAYYRQRNAFNTVKLSTLAFWDAFLKSNAAGRDFLKGARLRSDVGTAGAVEIK